MILLYPAAAFLEIGGCFAVWAWWRAGASPLWLIPGIMALAAFAYLLALTPALTAGRSFAAYGGVYIAASLAWMWAVEGIRPDRADAIGAAFAIAGAAIIVLAPRT